ISIYYSTYSNPYYYLLLIQMQDICQTSLIVMDKTFFNLYCKEDAAMISITVRYFGSSSSATRKKFEVVSLEDAATLKNLIDFLILKYDASLRNLFYDRLGEFKPLVMLLINGKATDDLTYTLKDGDEISLAPLIAGG
ncbi:MAG: MoaD/ThiS family protein, partial [Nitrososphaerales archaeon]